MSETENIGLQITSESDLSAIDRFIEALRAIETEGGNLAGALEQAREGAANAEEATKKAGETAENGAKGFKILGLSLTDLKSGLGLVTGGLKTIAGVVKSAIGEITSVTTKIDDIGDIAALTGDKVENVSRLAGAFGELGIPLGTLEGTLRPFNDALADSVARAREGADTLPPFGQRMRDMGIAMTDAAGNARSLAEMFPEIVRGLNEHYLGAERAAAATDIFGRGANDLVDILSKTPEELDALIERSDLLGTTLTDKTVAAAETFNNTLSELKQVGEAWKQHIIMAVLPAVQELTDGLLALHRAGMENTAMQQEAESFLKRYAEAHGLVIDATKRAAPPLIDLTGLTDTLFASDRKLEGQMAETRNRLEEAIRWTEKYGDAEQKLADILTVYYASSGMAAENYLLGALGGLDTEMRARERQERAITAQQDRRRQVLEDGSLLEQRSGDVIVAALDASAQAAEDATPSFGEWAQAVSDATYEAGVLADQLYDLHMGSIEGRLAIEEYGRKFDEAFARGLTVDNIGSLVQGLANATTKAQELGDNLPQSQLDDLKGRAEDLRGALAGLDLTPEERAALTEWLNIINGQLGDIKTSADNAAGAMSGVGRGTTPGGGGTAVPIANAAGGEIQRTGWSLVHRGEIIYNPAEPGGGSGYQEAVRKGKGIPTPAAAAAAPIIVQVVLDRKVVAEAVAKSVAAAR